MDDSKWYPTNYAEIETKCRQQFPIDDAMIVDDNGRFRVKDSPMMRSYFFCTGTSKNIFRPDMGFDADRIVYDIHATYKFNCDVALVQDCLENNAEESQTEDVLYFNAMKCVLESAYEECDRIAKEVYL